MSAFALRVMRKLGQALQVDQDKKRLALELHKKIWRTPPVLTRITGRISANRKSSSTSFTTFQRRARNVRLDRCS